jgi:hypothetical protein
LYSIKKLIGVGEEDTSFDLDLIVGINSALAILTQLGVGPPDGFAIQNEDATWSDFLGDGLTFEAVKSYVHLKVKLLFDPPTSAALIESIKNLLSELEWRISVQRDILSTKA